MDQPAFIWDLDGTLLDSYRIIVDCVINAYQTLGLALERDAVHKEVITGSVGTFLSKMEKETGISVDRVKKLIADFSADEQMNIRPVRHAKEILQLIRNAGAQNYVFTHKGASTEMVLRNLGLFDYFEEIITGRDGFPRKPDPSAVNFLIKKHELVRGRTFYVGDRKLDVECAENAGIGSILYLPNDSFTVPTGRETYVVKDLLEISDILERKHYISDT